MDPKKLLDEIKGKLTELSGLVSSSELEGADKESLEGLVQGFDAFYTNIVGSGPSVDAMKSEEDPELAMKPANVGKAKVQPMMQEPGIG